MTTEAQYVTADNFNKFLEEFREFKQEMREFQHAVDKRFDQVDARFNYVEKRLDRLEDRQAEDHKILMDLWDNRHSIEITWSRKFLVMNGFIASIVASFWALLLAKIL